MLLYCILYRLLYCILYMLLYCILYIFIPLYFVDPIIRLKVSSRRSEWWQQTLCLVTITPSDRHQTLSDTNIYTK